MDIIDGSNKKDVKDVCIDDLEKLIPTPADTSFIPPPFSQEELEEIKKIEDSQPMDNVPRTNEKAVEVLTESFVFHKFQDEPKEEKTKQTKILRENFKNMIKTKDFQRIHEISFRVDQEEKFMIESMAKKFNFKNVSEYIRFVSIHAQLVASVVVPNENKSSTIQDQQTADVLYFLNKMRLSETIEDKEKYLHQAKLMLDAIEQYNAIRYKN